MWCAAGGGGSSQGELKDFDAFFFGAGLEVEIIPHLTLFTEYTFATDKRGSDTGNIVREQGAGVNRMTTVDINIRQLQTIKGGLKYYF